MTLEEAKIKYRDAYERYLNIILHDSQANSEQLKEAFELYEQANRELNEAIEKYVNQVFQIRTHGIYAPLDTNEPDNDDDTECAGMGCSC